jgi:3-oxoacyl-[acyl-carrier protein] reductase
MDMGLRDRVAVVSCGTVELDLACARALRAEGAVVVAAVPTDPAPGDWEVVSVETGSQEIDALLDAALAGHGRVDVVALGSPPSPSTPIDAVEVDDLFRAWEPVVDTVGAYQRALGTMIPNGWGRFVHVASSAAKSVLDDVEDLDALEALSILALHKIVANEFGAQGITANTVLHDSQAPEEDVAAAVTFFASERAAYLTGLAMTVDAGAGASIY